MSSADELLLRVGTRVKTRRTELGWSRRELAERTGLSERFLTQVEGGQGNPSIRSLAEIAGALETTPSALLEAPSEVLALLGLRGAGKSTVGRAVAEALDRPFVELDARVEEAAGLSLSEIWELHGEAYYRRLERETLGKILARAPKVVIATGGGIVADVATWDVLRRGATTVWLKARPELHWERVVAQGDHRPMANDPLAMKRLRRLLVERESLYKQADFTVDTSDRDVPGVVAEVVQLARGERRS